MNSQIDEFERIMLDYLKGEISSEDMQKLTILLKRENACREKYREIARSYALASSSWFARRKEQNFEQLCDTLNFYSSRKHSFFVSIRPRACFSPSYNKVKSQTKHVWLLTLL